MATIRSSRPEVHACISSTSSSLDSESNFNLYYNDGGQQQLIVSQSHLKTGEGTISVDGFELNSKKVDSPKKLSELFGAMEKQCDF